MQLETAPLPSSRRCAILLPSCYLFVLLFEEVPLIADPLEVEPVSDEGSKGLIPDRGGATRASFLSSCARPHDRHDPPMYANARDDIVAPRE